MAPVPTKQRKSLKLQCEWGSCSEVLTAIQAFTSHLMIHAEDFIARSLSIEQCLAEVDHNDTDEYQCQWVDCGYVTTEGSAALLRHLLFHGYHTRIKWQGTVERERCKVEACQLEPHSRNIIPEVPSSFVCSWTGCSFMTNNPDYFYCHVEMHSQMEEPSGANKQLACRWTDCHIKTKDKYKLRDHLRCHSQEKRFGCSQCGGLFYNRTKFFDHISRQSILTDPNYQCSHCSKVFASERLLRDHMRHHVNHYKCPFCDMTCPAPSVLKKHITWRHSTDRPFTCELCHHRAKTRTDMRRHMESHNADDAYQCDISKCDFSCKSLSGLRSHFRKNHSDYDEQRYMCHLCQAKFTRGFHLTQHLKKKHRFKWPSGHVRFRYKEHDDGFLRLQTVRYESIELTQQILQEPPSLPAPPPPSNPAAALPPPSSVPSRPIPTAIHAASTAPPSSQGDGVLVVTVVGVGHGARAGVVDAGSKKVVDALVTRKKKRKSKSPRKCKLTPRDTPWEDGEGNSAYDIPIEQFQYVEEIPEQVQSGRKQMPGERVYIHTSSNDDTSGEKERNSPVVSLNSPHAGQTVLSTLTNAQARHERRVVLQNGGQPLSNAQSHSAIDGIHQQDDHQTNMSEVTQVYEFPIEQMQCLDDSSDRGSAGEPTPKKARLELSHVIRESGINIRERSDEEEKLRNLYPRLEDDRMAMAVEAMTNLSRGIGHL